MSPASGRSVSYTHLDVYKRQEQLSKETELKEEEVQLNADLSKINKQMDELKAKLNDFGVSLSLIHI